MLTVSVAQGGDCEATTLEEFFNCYGGAGPFSTHSVNAVTTFIQAEDALWAGDYTQAKTLVENLFNTYPRGSNLWWSVFNDPNGANIGTPHAYYGLRMIEDIAAYQLNNHQAVEARKALMKIVLVGCSEGIQPTTETELLNGTGSFVTNNIDASLRENDYRIVRQSFDFFSSYVTAITGGQLELEIEILELPDLCMQVGVSNTKPYVASGSIAPVWEALSDEVKESTDWWWILYPSHVPEFPTFNDEAFITGGMGLDQKGGPAFIIDDKWIVRKPAHLGAGNYTDIERRIYLPQWFQHEFFHHLYRAYPELGLEVNGHDWFNLDFWPSDFEGQFEADFYAESLHKRLQTDCVPLVTKLITRIDDELQQQFSTLSMDELTGLYSLDNILNDWHVSEIIKEGDKYYWKNKANVQWEVIPNLAAGRLETGPDSPYPGQDFFIELYQMVDGTYVPGVTALKFQGEFYQKRFDLVRESVPIEIVLGLYERIPAVSIPHTGNIIKEAGQFYWENTAGDRWLLTPNIEDECFSLDSNSPTPDQKFQLILTEDECGIYALGFKYLDDYYWRPKRDELNGSPGLINAIADLELPEGFGSYTIDLSEVFADPEGDALLLFASSSESALISTQTNSQQLVLSGGEPASATILVMAVDANGGLAIDEFKVQVGITVSSHDAAFFDQNVSIFPNPAGDYISIVGALSDYNISLFSADKSYQRELSPSGQELRIDLSHLSPGLYMIQFEDLRNGSTKIEKVIKY